MLSRIETINRTTAQIMAGDLGRRIVVEGSGDEFDAPATNLESTKIRGAFSRCDLIA